jgi:hypothetical protein
LTFRGSLPKEKKADLRVCYDLKKRKGMNRLAEGVERESE